MSKNFERMLQLVGEFFDVKNDPEQLNVNEDVINRLVQIHPSTISEHVAGDGPVVWILIIPTLEEVMHRFIKGEISEQKLLDETPAGVKYDAIYLCSATVLPEYRKRGLAKRMTVEAINNIREDHNIHSLFVWPFSKEGEALAEAVAEETGLPLYKRAAHKPAPDEQK